MQQFGSLEPVELRLHWNDEARHFTPWLAQEENIRRLSDTLGLDLEVEAIEVPVGPYRADVVARDLATDQRVIIENQLEKTDHDHLGKIITYASGLEATTMIWIAKTFTEEHRRALDFLNENVTPNLRLFGIEIQLWQIGDSLPAPLFKVISSPNEYTAAVKETTAAVSASNSFYLEFWTAFLDFCGRTGSTLRIHKPSSKSTMNLPLGRKFILTQLAASRQERRISCWVYVPNDPNKVIFGALARQREGIERQLGPLDWKEFTKGSRIDLHRTGVDIEDRLQWEASFTWLRDQAERFQEVFAPLAKQLQPTADSEPAEATMP